MTQQQSRGYTAAEVANLLEKARSEHKSDISMSTFYRLAREGYIKKTLPEDRVKEALYDVYQVHDLIEHGTPTKRKLRVKPTTGQELQQPEPKVRSSKKDEGATDWIQPSDLAYVYVVDTELYGVENSVSPTVTLTWWRKNPYACRILFNKHKRKEIWGALSIIPMEEETIYRLLSGDLKEQDITADQVLAYQPGHKYSCYIASVAILPEHRQAFGQLMHSILSSWCEQYPDIQITSLYGFALDEEEGAGLRLIRKLFFAPRYDLGNNAWELRLDRYSPSPVIQRFQECLRQKQLNQSSIHLQPIRDSAIPDNTSPTKDLSMIAGVEYQSALSEDLPAFSSIDEAIFGPASLTKEEYVGMHGSWYERNNEVFHVLRSKERVVGYVSTLPLPLDKIMKILREDERLRDVKPEEIDLFKPGKRLNIYIAVMGIDKGFTKHQKKLLAGKLISGLTETFRIWGQRGVDIRAIYARSRFEEGIGILRHADFQEMKDISPVNGKQIFCLELDTEDGPFAKIYKEGLEEYHP